MVPCLYCCCYHYYSKSEHIFFTLLKVVPEISTRPCPIKSSCKFSLNCQLAIVHCNYYPKYEFFDTLCKDHVV